jgi:hypothetical protein
VSGARELSPLDFNPFDGDFGDQSDVIFRDAMVKARKRYECCHCKGPIAVGELHRYQSGKIDGGLHTSRWCALCCAAMLETMREFSEEEDEDGTLEDAAFMAFENRYRETADKEPTP